MSKKCTICLQDKDESEFSLKNPKTGLLQWACKVCIRAQSKKHYLNNPDYYKAKAKQRRQRVVKIYRERISEYLLTHPCVDCGESDIVCLEFDHVQGDKIDNIGDLIRHDGAWGKIEEEISKCEVRCANCHRKRTARQFGYFRLGNIAGIDNDLN